MKNHPFLPTDVSVIIKNMIKLRFQFDRLSRKFAAPRVVPKADFSPPKADYFSSYQIHTMENLYKADKKPDENEDDCEKTFILQHLHQVELAQSPVITRSKRASELFRKVKVQ